MALPRDNAFADFLTNKTLDGLLADLPPDVLHACCRTHLFLRSEDTGGEGGKEAEIQLVQYTDPIILSVTGRGAAAPAKASPRALGAGKGKDAETLKRMLREAKREVREAVPSDSSSDSDSALADSDSDSPSTDEDGEKETPRVPPVVLDLTKGAAGRKRPAPPPVRREADKPSEPAKRGKTPTPGGGAGGKSRGERGGDAPLPGSSGPATLAGPLNPPPPVAAGEDSKTVEEIYWRSLQIKNQLELPLATDPLHYPGTVTAEEKSLLEAARPCSGAKTCRFAALENAILDQLLKGASYPYRERLMTFYFSTLLLYFKVRHKRFSDLRWRLQKRKKIGPHLKDLDLLSRHCDAVKSEGRKLRKLAASFGASKSGGKVDLQARGAINLIKKGRLAMIMVEPRGTDAERLRFLDRTMT